jgi:hypothetical protein
MRSESNMKQIQTCKLELLFAQVHTSLVTDVRNKHKHVKARNIKKKHAGSQFLNKFGDRFSS